MRIIKYCTALDPDTNKFRIAGVNGDIKLQKGYEKENDGIIWGLKCGTMVKGHYTQEDKRHNERMKAYKPLEQGELVSIEGKLYKTNIKGNYSDAVIFDPTN